MMNMSSKHEKEINVVLRSLLYNVEIKIGSSTQNYSIDQNKQTI